jgi:hypothetical protein
MPVPTEQKEQKEQRGPLQRRPSDILFADTKQDHHALENIINGSKSDTTMTQRHELPSRLN